MKKIKEIKEIKEIKNLNNFIKNNNQKSIIIFQKESNLDKKIIENIKNLFEYKNTKNICISIIDFETINNILDLNLKEDTIIEIKNFNIEKIILLKNIENLVSLKNLKQYLIKDFKELEKLIKGKKEYIIVFTDNIEKLSKIMFNPYKTIKQLYKQAFNIKIKNLPLKIMYTTKESINKIIILKEEEIQLPLMFKLDKGSLSFPIHIKYQNKEQNQQVEEVLKKYNIFDKKQ